MDETGLEDLQEGRSSGQAIALALLFAGIMAATVAGFAGRRWLPEVASEHGAGVDGTIRYLLWSTGAIFVIGHLALVAFLLRYGRGRPAGDPRTSVSTERWWSVLPVLVFTAVAEVGVLMVGLPVFAKMYGPLPDDALVVEVTAQQFAWNIRYPGKDGVFGRTDPRQVNGTDNPVGLDPDDPAAQDDVVLLNQLYLPAGRFVQLRLRSLDVLHSFSVAAFRVKQDIVPGITVKTQFKPIQAGTWDIACAELCGLGHFRMKGSVYVQEPAEFEAWLAAQRGWWR